ncbi:hypothetical protein HELRODRAFT_70072 [Helobdella robusta]|uniref:non-specific serine/threonine protein kinase n=1 Tax=Helobdella robusta TaxID=6412 RepID=T1G022_HELRO|nr:hypothetical protein HELRODRAFT_70072 [Helobdella robusta]ESN91811.1 hypothetical protein HELRODRAFT_70072 [Helobdella robusta]
MFQADVIQRYLIGDLLGIGSYGIVKHCIDSITLRRMAVKIFIAKRIRRIPNGPENILNELKIMRKIKHDNIVKVFNITCREEDHFMMMELCKFNLGNVLEQLKNNRLPITVAHHFYKHLVTGLDYLQSVKIIHMDIKPDNMLISYDNVLKMSDFGVAQQLDMFDNDDTCTRYRGCPIIQPPEVARGDDKFSGFKLDIWCSGVTLFKMLVGEYPYDAINEFQLIEKIIKGVYEIPSWLDSRTTGLLEGGVLFF